jgi:hypothetical protein
MTATAQARRRLSTLLVAFGLVGTVLFGALAVTLLISSPSLLNAGETGGSIESARQLADDSAAALRDLDRTLANSSDALDDSARTLNDLAATMRSGADALRISVLGQQPFSAVANQFASTADQAAATAQSITVTAGSVASIRAAIALMIADLGSLRTQLDELDIGLGRLTNPLVWIGILIALLWLLALAAVVAWIGWQLRARVEAA